VLFVYAGNQQAYAAIRRSLQLQLANTNDALQELFIIRGICIAPLEPEQKPDLIEIADRVSFERLDFHRAARRKGPPADLGEARKLLPGFEGRPGGPPGPPGAPFDGPRRGDRPPRFDGSRPIGPPRQAEGPPWAGGAMREVVSYVKALAYFRAGDPQQASRLLNSEPRGRGGEGILTRAPLLALVYWELGEKEQANQQLTEGIDNYRAWLKADPRSPSNGPSNASWLDGLETWILLNEAHQNILGSPFPKTIEAEPDGHNQPDNGDS
jgi:hypothetical protein